MRLRAAVVGLLLTGCVGVPWRPDAMQEAAQVEALDVRFQSDGSGALDVRLAVSNPTSDDATLGGVDFELVLDGRRFAVGAQALDVPLAAAARHTLELRFPLSSARTTGRGLAVYRAVRLTGGVVMRFGTTERRAPFRDERVKRLAWVPLEEPRTE
ncbi:hypothetical protein P2318_06215 [Myxococcaceae bacterium GXIMD 01537]